MSLHNHTYTNPPTIGLITLTQAWSWRPGPGSARLRLPCLESRVWLLSVQSSLDSGVQLEPGTHRPSEGGEVKIVRIAEDS